MRSHRNHPSDCLVTQHQGCRPTATPVIGVEIGTTEGGQGDGHQGFSGSESGTRAPLIAERGISTGENGGQNAGFHRCIDTEDPGLSRGFSRLRTQVFGDKQVTLHVCFVESREDSVRAVGLWLHRVF